MTKLFTKTQILAFLAPYIALASGLLAAWLFVHFHLLGVWHITQSAVAQAISGIAVFGITALLTFLGHHFHWLPLAKAALLKQEVAHKAPAGQPVRKAVVTGTSDKS